MPSAAHTELDQDGFRPRGTDGSRIDSFSDVVFGFALSILVVSLGVPRTFDELLGMLRGFVPFAFCFWFLTLIWIRHYRFFRRFGLHDPATIRINAALLFVVLFYVYPLKFLFAMALGANHGQVFSGPTQERDLMVLYGVGVASLNGLLAMLNIQGWRQRYALQLSPREQMLTRSYIADNCVVAGIGLLSCGVAWLLPLRHAGSSGWTYLLIVAHRPIHAAIVRRKARRLGMP